MHLVMKFHWLMYTLSLDTVLDLLWFTLLASGFRSRGLAKTAPLMGTPVVCFLSLEAGRTRSAP